MSGGRHSPTPGSEGGINDERCEHLSFEAWVQSLQSRIAEDLTVGEILNVGQTVDPADSSYRRVELRCSSGDLVGTLTDGLPRLLACMSRGFTYVAEVLTADRGNVRVRVGRP